MNDIKVSLSVELPGVGVKPVLQNINIYANAYVYMTSTESPGRFDAVKWGKMTKKDRLVYHLGLIAWTLGGKVREYVVFKD